MTRPINGVDIDSLTETLGELKKDPELGHCRFRASNRWMGQTRTLNRIRTFYAAKQEMEHPWTFEIPTDEPTLIGGGDTEANPVECLLASLASCVTASIVVHAAASGVEIEAIDSEIEGDIDLNGFAGTQDVPKGFQQIRLTLRVASDADVEQLRRFAQMSPTYDTVTRGTDVELQIEKRPPAETKAPEREAHPTP